MARILVMNGYSFRDLQIEVDDGRQPSHLLYAVDHLRRHGHEIIDVSGPQQPFLVKLDRRLAALPLPLGSMDHQILAVLRLNKIDLIYSPGDLRTHTLYAARAAGLFQTPIVSIAHHPLRRGRLKSMREPWLRLIMAGAENDSIPTLSTAVAAELNDIAGRPVARAITWGPAAEFYPPSEYPGTGVVAIGRTGRDFVTVARAARMTGVPLTIISWAEYLKPIESELQAPNIETIFIEEMIPHADLLVRFARARAIAVPLFEGASLSGLTGMMDALGAGKPLLVTRKPTLDLDVAQLRIGYSFDVGDVAGWADAMRALHADPDAAVDMGRRARALVEQGMNAERFGADIAALVDGVLTRTASGRRQARA